MTDPQISMLPVLGDGLMLGRDPDHRVKLVAFVDGRARSLGPFTDVREAWQAIDALDLAALDAAHYPLVA